MKKIWVITIFVVLSFLTIGLVYIFYQPKEKAQEDIAEVEIPEPCLKFGLPVDSFHVEEGRIKPNQNLSDILTKYDVGMGRIDRLAKKSKDTFDVRKMKSGNRYYAFQSLDSLKKIEYLIYERSAIEYVVFELNDSLKTSLGEKKIVSELKSAKGVINSSLWNTMSENNLNPVLALELSDIYAWTIDFFGIQKGDRFRVIYEEQYVDSHSIGIGTIHAVQFDHMGEPNYAFRFFQDKRFDYYDDKGNSLRKAFLKAPLKFSRISSQFSHSRMHPVLKIRRPHRGVDYAAPRGTPVQSIGDGNVVAKAYQRGGGGRYLKIKHNSVYTTTYMHLSGYAKGIAPGVRVKQGQIIGYVGSSGLASGPHLDFRIAKNGQLVDPLKVKAPPVQPVKKESMADYSVIKDSMMIQLEKIIWEETSE